MSKPKLFMIQNDCLIQSSGDPIINMKQYESKKSCKWVAIM